VQLGGPLNLVLPVSPFGRSVVLDSAGCFARRLHTTVVTSLSALLLTGISTTCKCTSSVNLFHPHRKLEATVQTCHFGFLVIQCVHAAGDDLLFHSYFATLHGVGEGSDELIFSA
jgi:hypothetical protein